MFITVALLAFLPATQAVVALKLAMTRPLTVPIIASSSANASQHRRNITMAMFAQYASQVFPMGPICTESIQLALDQVKRVSKNLNDYEIMIEIFDDLFSRPVVVSSFIQQMRMNDDAPNRLPLTLGGISTGHYFTGQMMQHFNVVGVTVETTMNDIDKRRRNYPSYYAIEKTDLSYDILAYFLQAMNWHRFTIISENSDFFNRLESRLIELMDQINDTKCLGIVKYPYISGSLPESPTVESAVAELALLQPRIIVIDSSSPARFACWLYRYKLYGPNYVILVMTSYFFLANDSSRFTPWCTEAIVGEVLKNVIFFGQTNLINLYGDNALDSTGLSGKAYEMFLKERIEQPQQSSVWWYWRTKCYDTVLAAGYLLDSLEGALARKNETLTDWVVSGVKFKEHGEQIVSDLKDALYATRFTVYSSEVAFQRNTTINAFGAYPIAIFQFQNDNAFPSAIAILEGGKSFKLGPNKMKWGTVTGLPPAGSIRIIQVKKPHIKQELYVTVTVLSCVELSAALLVLLFQIKLRETHVGVKNSIITLNCFILLGDALLQGYPLVQTSDTNPFVHLNCMAAHGFLFVGLASVLFGMAAKLEIAMSVLLRVRCVEGVDNRRQSKYHGIWLLPFDTRVTVAIVVGLLYLAINLLLLIIWFVSEPMLAKLVNVDFVVSDTDDSLAFQYYCYQCEMKNSVITTAILCTLCGMYAILILRSCFLAYVLRSKRFEKINDSRAITKCLYGTLLLLACCGIIAGAIFVNDQPSIHLAISFGIFACVILNLAIVFLPKLLRQSDLASNAAGDLISESCIPVNMNTVARPSGTRNSHRRS